MHINIGLLKDFIGKIEITNHINIEFVSLKAVYNCRIPINKRIDELQIIKIN